MRRLDDDLNTPEALSAVFGFVRDVNAGLDSSRHKSLTGGCPGNGLLEDDVRHGSSASGCWNSPTVLLQTEDSSLDR